MASQAIHPAARRRRAVFAFLLSGTALLPAMAAAQQAAEEDGSILLDPVRIHGGSVVATDSSIVAGFTATGSKTPAEVINIPAQVSIVTQKEMETRAPQTLMQALSYTASVSVDEYGSDNRYDFYRIRGFYQTGNRTYRDGLPLRSFNFTGGRIEPYSVQRIEVLKGSTSTLFGLNAPGGLVNVITKRPQDDPFGEVYTTVGEDHAELGFDFGAPFAPGSDWTYRLTAKWQDASTDGIEALTDDRRYLAFGATWKPTGVTSLTLLANYDDTEGNTGNSIPVGSTASRDTFFGEPDFADMDREERSFGYEFSHEFDNGLTFRQNARQSHIEMVYKQAYLDGASPTGRSAYLMNGEIDRFAIDNQLQYDAAFGAVESRTLLGLDYVNDDLHEQTWFGTAGPVDRDHPVPCGLPCIDIAPSTLTDMTQKATGLYLQEELTLDRWILTLGARHDRVETDVENGAGSNRQTAFTKRIGMTYKAGADLAFYANYSESFDPVSSGYVPYLAADAKPQEGRQYEVGAKYRPAGADALITAALFDLSQTNVPRVNPDFTYSQVGRIDVGGLEIEGRMALNDRLNLLFVYSYWDAEIVGGADDGRRPQLTPEHLASAWVDYTWQEGPLAGLRLGGGMRFLGPRFADDANTVKIGSATVFDAMASYPLSESTEFAVNVSNLFDRDYVATYNFDNTAVFYGDGRMVTATLRHRW